MDKAGTLLGCNFHIKCYVHTINLAAQKGLKIRPIEILLSRICCIVGFFHQSTTAAAKLRSQAELLGLPDHKLIADVPTRWNSTYDMISRFLEMQCAIIAVLRSKDLAKIKEKDLNTLTDDDICLADEVMVCLKPLKVVTTTLCAESVPTISVIMPLHRKLIDSIFQHSDDDSLVIAQMKRAVVDDLQDRYTHQEETLTIASALDPRFKALPFLSDARRNEIFTKILQNASEIIVRVEAEHDTDHSPVGDSEHNELPPLPQLTEQLGVSANYAAEHAQPVCKKLKSGIGQSDMTEKVTCCSGMQELLGDVYITGVETSKTEMEELEEELKNYRAFPSIPLDSNPLQWRKSHEQRFPRLAKLSKSLLCIPSTSVPSERVFSTAGDIVNAQCSALKPNHVDALIFLKKI